MHREAVVALLLLQIMLGGVGARVVVSKLRPVPGGLGYVISIGGHVYDAYHRFHSSEPPPSTPITPPADNNGQGGGANAPGDGDRELQGIVEDIWANVMLYREDCDNITNSTPPDPAYVPVCKFVDCAISDRQRRNASSTAEDCFLVYMVSLLRSNATERHEACDGVPQGAPEYCRFATCVANDPRGDADPKAVGKDCYASSYSIPTGTGSGSGSTQNGTAAAAPSTVAASILGGLNVVFVLGLL